MGLWVKLGTFQKDTFSRRYVGCCRNKPSTSKDLREQSQYSKEVFDLMILKIIILDTSDVFKDFQSNSIKGS